MLTTIVNKRTHKPTANDVYIGRPSKWSNPFVIGKYGNREQVIQRYSDYINRSRYLQKSLPELKGKILVCFCKPEACHGDILAKLANTK